MRTIGEILRTKRRERGLTLDQVSQMTKIRREYLVALEKNQYQKLPSRAYIRGFIKNYGRFLGLEVSPLLAIFRRDYQEEEKSPLAWMKKEKVGWTPQTAVIFLIVLAIFIFLSYLFWQYHLLLESPYRQLTK